MTLAAGTLRDRLRGIVTPADRTPPGRPGLSAPADAAGATGAPGTADVAAGTALPRDGIASAETVLGGAWHTSEGGRSFVVSRRYEPDTAHGNQLIGRVAEALHRAERGAALLATGAPRVPFVFFDLETTGLSGGAGTHAFLVGCARFDADGSFVTEQHLMVDYGAERGMLAAVHERLACAGALVTFNGKSFDAPVIETRYLFHRLSSPCAELPHVDVLHPARRFWGSQGDQGCSLVSLEQRLLGAQRVGDVPGFEIPARYFEYIRSGDARPLAAVFEHNRLDLLSLAALTARLLALIEQGPAGIDDAREALALARIDERHDDLERATAGFERAAWLAGEAAARGMRRVPAGADWQWSPSGIRAEALRALALLARRGRRFDEAAARWRDLLEVPGCPAHVRREATEALAIHHEHRVRDLAAAKLFALKSLEAGNDAAWGDAVRHRLARIERKMVSERSLFPSLPLPPSCGSPTSGRRTSS